MKDSKDIIIVNLLRLMQMCSGRFCYHYIINLKVKHMELSIYKDTRTLIELIAELNDIEERFTSVLARIASADQVDAYYNNDTKNFDALIRYFGECLVMSIVNDNSRINDALAE